jgi:hypothetical protein
LAYKIASNDVINTTSVFHDSLYDVSSIVSTINEHWIPESFQFTRFTVGDRLVLANADTLIISQLYSNDYIKVGLSPNVSAFFATSGVEGRQNIDIGDGLIILADWTNSTSNTETGRVFVYNYSGSLQYELSPAANNANSYFGTEVSISSNLFSVSSRESGGCVYVYYANSTLKSTIARPFTPAVDSAGHFTSWMSGKLIPGYRVIASATGAYGTISPGTLPNAGAVYLFSTDGTQLLTSNQRVDISSDDRFGSSISYTSGTIVAGSPRYSSQTAPFPGADGLVTGIDIYNNFIFRYDPGTYYNLGAYVEAGGGFIASSGVLLGEIKVFDRFGSLVETISAPLNADATFGHFMKISNGRLFAASNNRVFSYKLPSDHNSHFEMRAHNKAEYY